jgi:hypothetical protein
LVRYMLQLTPDEQRRLLATAPVAPPAAAPPAQKAQIRSKSRGGETTFNRSRRAKRPALAENGSVRIFSRPAAM